MNLLFTNFAASSLNISNSRYIQYRTILESDDQNNLCDYGSGGAACSPELKSVSLGPTHYDTSNPTVTSKSSIGSSFQTLDANGFTETLGSGSCTGARYTLSSDGVNFYYFNGSAWVLSSNTYATATSATVISTNLASLAGVMGTGTLQVKAFLNSDGVTACEINNIQISGAKQ